LRENRTGGSEGRAEAADLVRHLPRPDTDQGQGREGQNVKSRDRLVRLETLATTAANPPRRAWRKSTEVNPEVRPPERSEGPAPTGAEPHLSGIDDLWEIFLSRDNLSRALRRVERNKGAPGTDGLRAEHLRAWCHEHWPEVRQALDVGSYRPAPVRQVLIPKPDGGQRRLGVPTVLDRLIQQALLQVLTPIFDPTFSESSFGFRPGRSAHQAVRAAEGYLQQGLGWVVDVDLDRFFDRVQHDVLMARVARKVFDHRVLRLIRRYLVAGIMADGVKQPSAEGTPQGSPLTPQTQ